MWSNMADPTTTSRALGFMLAGIPLLENRGKIRYKVSQASRMAPFKAGSLRPTHLGTAISIIEPVGIQSELPAQGNAYAVTARLKG